MPTDTRTPLVPRAVRHHGAGSRLWLLLALLSAASLAWVLLALQHGGLDWGQAPPHEHSSLPVAAPPVPPNATHSLRPVGWFVMVVAMMLPPAWPLFRVVTRIASGVRYPLLTLMACVAAFLAVWLGAGGVLLAADLLARNALGGSLAAHPQLPAAAAVAVAGIYQFTPLKRACLTACRSPVAIVMTTWTGQRTTVAEAAAVGVRYGAVCVGCCWALMILSLVVAVAAMPLMILTTLVMASERLLPRVRRLVPLYGVFCLVLAGYLALGVVAPGWLPTT